MPPNTQMDYEGGRREGKRESVERDVEKRQVDGDGGAVRVRLADLSKD